MTVAGHRTSLSVEEAFWDELKAIARAEGVSVTRLVERIDRARRGNLSSAIRVFVLEQVKARDRKR